MGHNVPIAISMLDMFQASQLACMFEFWASAGHVHLQGIGSGAMFVACILYVAYHHLSQHHGGLGTSSRSEEPHHWQLLWFLPLFAFACSFCMAGLCGASVGLRQR